MKTYLIPNTRYFKGKPVHDPPHPFYHRYPAIVITNADGSFRGSKEYHIFDGRYAEWSEDSFIWEE